MKSNGTKRKTTAPNAVSNVARSAESDMVPSDLVTRTQFKGPCKEAALKKNRASQKGFN
eukprot:CAMPEP_0119316162 /NCGR_PEP_ID=MMETSP1333-20130426/38776_1 /TAXON_ID=418940 /ORGANISM="Scyphosphaera apsteinii, Strain RCC1455" /LENGTH=58 /DNA_ID=CAMNT_0007321739 /DNA_START=267 /DNA_END=440 /DNA_ORIENTATION=+